MKRALLTGAVVVAVALLATLPPLIELRTSDSRYIGMLEEALGCRIESDSTTLRILPLPAIRVANLALSDRRAAGAEPFLRAKDAAFELRLWPLLAGRIEIGAVVIERAVLRVDRAPRCSDSPPRKASGRENASARHGEARRGTRPARVELKNAELRLDPTGGKPLTIRGLGLSVSRLDQPPFAYRLVVSLPGFKPLALEGLLETADSGRSLRLLQSRLEAPGISFGVTGSIAALERWPRIELQLRNEALEVGPFFQLLSALGRMPKGVDIAGSIGLEIALSGALGDLNSETRAVLKGVRVKNSAYLDGTVSGQIRFAAPLWSSQNGIGRLSGSGTIEVTDGVLQRLDLASRAERAAGISSGAARSQRSTPFESFRTSFTLREGILYLRGLSLRSPTLKAEGSGRLHIAAGTVDLGLETVLEARRESSPAARGSSLAVPLRIRGPLGGLSIGVDSEAGAPL